MECPEVDLSPFDGPDFDDPDFRLFQLRSIVGDGIVDIENALESALVSGALRKRPNSPACDDIRRALVVLDSLWNDVIGND